jgi:hypothetical protein
MMVRLRRIKEVSWYHAQVELAEAHIWKAIGKGVMKFRAFLGNESHMFNGVFFVIGGVT